MQGLWMHGNLLQHLPEDIGNCSDLRQISLAGNCLEDFPKSIGKWTALRDLNLSGNKLSRLPVEVGNLCTWSLLIRTLPGTGCLYECAFLSFGLADSYMHALRH